MNLEELILILPFAFALHNFEEVLKMERWSKSIPKSIHPQVTTVQFAIAVLIFTILGFIVVYNRQMYQQEEIYYLVVSAFSGILLLNVCFPHLIATIIFKKYSPGLITALFLNLPITAVILLSIKNQNILSTYQLILSVIIGGFVGIVLVFTLLKFGKLIEEKYF